MHASSVRQAVRVLLIDPSDRLLLLWHSRPHDSDHWAPPGGGVEAGESLQQAAARELVEEIGLTGIVLRRPVWTWQHRFSYNGVPVRQHETYYAVRLARAIRPSGAPTDLASDGISSARWWSVPELAHCRDEVWPTGLASLTPELLLGDLDPVHPTELQLG
jgi:8-oxo-dGTP pyrophosphatase MutT (NUDIX family)